MTIVTAWLPLLVARVGLYAALLWFFVWAVRWTRTTSPILATILAAGILVRIVLGSLLFVISYFGLPFFTRLQLGNGFWTLALDARSYFEDAARAVHFGISSIPAGSASPTYVRLLTVWMQCVGISPASAVALNVVCYALAAVLIVSASHAVLPKAMALGAVTVSPALIIFGTQALKDSVCLLLIVLAMTGVRLWVDMLGHTNAHPWRNGILGTVCLSAAVLGFGGIRAYFALFIVASVCATALASIVMACGRIERLKVLASYTTLVSLLWVMFVVGAGAYYAYYGNVLRAAVGSPLRPIAELDGARTGFVATGGATAVVAGSGSDDLMPLQIDASHMTTSGILGRAVRLVRGCAVMFVPISLLRSLSLVSFSGGRGLLLVTDVDTLVMDAALLCSLLLLFRNRHLMESMPVAIFALVLAGVTALSMAYVVTNYGTLFRLRLLAVTSIWVLPAFVGRHGRAFRDGAA
jgi:hypothetical protein